MRRRVRDVLILTILGSMKWAVAREAKPQDMREFFKMKEKVWTFNSTLPLPYTCKMDVCLNITSNKIDFNQSVYEDPHVRSVVRRGHFYENYEESGHPWNILFITDYRTGYTRKQMMYVKKGVCAVNMVERYVDTFPPNYELLLKGKYLRDPPEECLTNYRAIARKGRERYFNNDIEIYGVAVYTRDCEKYYRRKK
ncbi:uncharacterized protein LOC142588742 [Dermacentor variabilis]|uniref:uncharacterized protein LOC142588742 n=1 Tax=Dermacentor variabilis TaxID=34621 RepID=UPI003F5BA430